ncbi:glycerol channel [Recurvomyces mirabilis]|nr:glycerol channel [Recurvomyces mirabilis]
MDGSSGKSHKEDPLAIRNLPTGEASHHEHAPQSPGLSSRLTKTTSDLAHTRQWLGLHPSAPVEEEHDYAEHSKLWWSKIRIALKEPFAEFFGTFILVLFGDGSVAQVLLSTGQASAPGGNGFGNYQSINWGWGLGVMLGIYVAGDSGY